MVLNEGINQTMEKLNEIMHKRLISISEISQLTKHLIYERAQILLLLKPSSGGIHQCPFSNSLKTLSKEERQTLFCEPVSLHYHQPV